MDHDVNFTIGKNSYKFMIMYKMKEFYIRNALNTALATTIKDWWYRKYPLNGTL